LLKKAVLFSGDVAVATQSFLSLRTLPTFLLATMPSATSSPKIVVQRAGAPDLLDGLIWPKTGCASIA
jgi:hypothetical protein